MKREDVGKPGQGLKLEMEPGEATRLRASANLRALRQQNEARYAVDPWAFLDEAVWTLDQRGQGGGVRRYPGSRLEDGKRKTCPCGGCGNYLEHMVHVWHTLPPPKRLAIPKSRRLIVSWTMVALHYWLARYHPASFIGFASRKQGQTEDEGSAELVKRAKFIHDHLPLDVAPRPVKYGFARLAFTDNDSTIVGIAQGADQARQYTFTAYLADEFAFWERAGETYAALLPTLEGGGRFTAISSANPGFMQQIVYDAWGVEA